MNQSEGPNNKYSNVIDIKSSSPNKKSLYYEQDVSPKSKKLGLCIF